LQSAVCEPPATHEHRVVVIAALHAAIQTASHCIACVTALSVAIRIGLSATIKPKYNLSRKYLYSYLGSMITLLRSPEAVILATVLCWQRNIGF
jgi:hypothetical protein